MRNTLTLSLASILAFSLLGCTVQGDDTPAPTFKEQSGQDAFENQLTYPTAPKGFDVGDVLPNFKFVGYADYTANSGGLQLVNVADFYNPTGNDVFPEGSPYGAGTPKPRAINMLISSVWCGPCNVEARDILPGEYAKYKPQGGQFLAVLIDGPSPGSAATLSHLTNWSQKYATAYTMVIDPGRTVMDHFPSAYPSNMIVDTRTMEIKMVVSGVPPQTFWATFETLLQ